MKSAFEDANLGAWGMQQVVNGPAREYTSFNPKLKRE